MRDTLSPRLHTELLWKMKNDEPRMNLNKHKNSQKNSISTNFLPNSRLCPRSNCGKSKRQESIPRLELWNLFLLIPSNAFRIWAPLVGKMRVANSNRTVSIYLLTISFRFHENQAHSLSFSFPIVS